MDLTAASIIRASSGLLYCLLGLYLLVPRRRPAAARALGAWSFLFGIGFIVNNLFADVLARSALYLDLSGSTYVLLPFAAAATALYVPRRREGERWAFLIAAAVFLIVFVVETFILFLAPPDIAEFGLPDDPTGGRYFWSNLPFTGTILALPLLCAIRAVREEDATRRRTLALVSLSVTAYAAFAAGADALASGSRLNYLSPVDVALAFAILGATCAVWLRAQAKHGGRDLLLAATAPVLCAFVGLAGVAAFGTDVFAWGVIGFARILGWTFLVWLVFKENGVGLDLSVRQGRNARLATAALAALFIVAQLAQNFLSSEYGLLTGGIIAGAVLFAANPVQKAIERATERKDAGKSASGDEAAKRREDVYLGALRLAMRDRTLTRDEEVHLHRLAEELGIGAGRAHELMVAVEGERRRKR